MKFKSYIQPLRWNADEDSGFTLIELLVATVIMSIVVTLAGSGFVAILQQNQKAEDETQARQNLNRALDHIANEVRRASDIQSSTVTGEVFQLTIPTVVVPNTTGTGQPRFTTGPIPASPLSNRNYATSSTSTYSVSTSSGVWRDPNDPRPRSIMRNGSFLVNNIQAPVTSEINRIQATCPNPTGANPNPNFRRSEGFYACIHSGGNRVDLFLYGRLSNNGTMLVESTVYTRANGF